MEGGQFYDNAINPTKILVNTPEGIKGLADYQSLFTEHFNPPYAEMASGPWGAGDIDSLLTGKIAFARIGAFDFAQIQQQNLTSKIGAMPQLSLNGKQITIGNVNSFGVFKGSKYPEQAWEFVKWAAQTGPDKTYAQLSDVPSDTTAFNQMSTYITPSVYVPTLLAAGKVFQPDAMTPHQQYSTDLTSIITDLANGKLTPAKAAQQLEQKGNADLAG